MIALDAYGVRLAWALAGAGQASSPGAGIQAQDGEADACTPVEIEKPVAAGKLDVEQAVTYARQLGTELERWGAPNYVRQILDDLHLELQAALEEMRKATTDMDEEVRE